MELWISILHSGLSSITIFNVQTSKLFCGFDMLKSFIDNLLDLIFFLTQSSAQHNFSGIRSFYWMWDLDIQALGVIMVSRLC